MCVLLRKKRRFRGTGVSRDFYSTPPLFPFSYYPRPYFDKAKRAGMQMMIVSDRFYLFIYVYAARNCFESRLPTGRSPSSPRPTFQFFCYRVCVCAFFCLATLATGRQRLGKCHSHLLLAGSKTSARARSKRSYKADKGFTIARDRPLSCRSTRRASFARDYHTQDRAQGGRDFASASNRIIRKLGEQPSRTRGREDDNAIGSRRGDKDQPSEGDCARLECEIAGPRKRGRETTAATTEGRAR